MAKAKRVKKTFTVTITEHYTKTYTIDAYDAEEAANEADALASDDMELAIPENFDYRDISSEEWK